MTKTVIERVGN